MTEFFQMIENFLKVHLWDNLVELVSVIMVNLSIASLRTAIQAAEYMGAYIQTLVVDLDSFGALTAIYSALPNDLIAILTLLNVPAAFTIIVGAFALKISLRVVFGR